MKKKESLLIKSEETTVAYEKKRKVLALNPYALLRNSFLAVAFCLV